MIQTDNYNFNKPDSEDHVLISDLNHNMDTIDSQLHSIEITKIDKSRILTTMEEIEAVTENGFLADARCVSGLNSNFADAGAVQLIGSCTLNKPLNYNLGEYRFVYLKTTIGSSYPQWNLIPVRIITGNFPYTVGSFLNDGYMYSVSYSLDMARCSITSEWKKGWDTSIIIQGTVYGIR